MNKRKYTRTWTTLLVCGLLFAVLCVTGVLNKQKIWPNLPVEFLQGGGAQSLTQGDEYGRVTGGPYMALPAGTYRIKWQIEGDGVNAVELLCSNDVAITPSRFETVPGDFEGEGVFEIADTTHNFSVDVMFESGTWIKMHNIRLYSPVYTDNYFTVAALMLMLVLGMFFYECGSLTPERRAILISLALAVMFASLPALREDAVLSADTPFHASRLNNLVDGLRNGQFPARLGGYSYNGYGGVTSIFYPDTLLYPQALMLMLGASMAYVINVLTIEIHALTALCMYVAARRIFSDKLAAAYAAMLYATMGFRLGRTYTSFMVGQILAVAVLPLFLLGLWEVCFGDKRRWPVLVLGATLVFATHLLTTALCAGLATVCVLAYGVRLWRERRLGALLLAILFTVLVNLTRLVPMGMMYLDGVTTSAMSFGFIDMARKMVQMFGTDKELGLALMLGLAALACVQLPDRQTRADIARFMVVGGLCVWLSTDSFPWQYVMAYTGDVMEVFQFPWRFMMIGMACLALCGGAGYAGLLRGQGAKGLLAVLAVIVLSTTPVIETAMERDVIEFGRDCSPYMLTPEYQIEGTNLTVTRSRAVLVEGDAALTQYEKQGTNITAQVEAGADATITFPLFGFKGYAATLNGERVDWTRGENNRLTVSVPSGTRGELRIFYEVSPIWRAADAVSLLSALALCGYVWKKRRAVQEHGGACR